MTGIGVDNIPSGVDTRSSVGEGEKKLFLRCFGGVVGHEGS